MSRGGKPVDLGRVRAAMGRLDALLSAHPELGERTARYLAGELTGRTLEKTMPPSDQMVVKLPRTLHERAAALLPRLAGAPELAAAGRPGPLAVIRVALALGLATLEKQYPPAVGAPRGGRGKARDTGGVGNSPGAGGS